MLEEAKLTQIKRELIEYADLVENMIRKAMQGLSDKNHELLNEVINQDEPRVNQLELFFDEICIQLIAQHQPAGRSLRTILMIYSINNNLERMGDHAVNVAEAALYLIERPEVKPLIDTPTMGGIVIGMINDSIGAFVAEDAALAIEVCNRDDTVDNLRTQIYRELITYMMSDSSTIERSLQLMKIASNLERVADRSTNICEDVIYMVEGRVIKHKSD